MIRLVASDLDGTLLRSDGRVSERTRAAITAAVAGGLQIAFVTGRPPRWLTEIADATGHNGVAVSANGAVLYDLASEQVLRSHALQPAELAAVTGQLIEAFPDVTFAVEYGLAFGHEPGYRHHWEISPTHDRQGNVIAAPFVAPLPEVIARPGVKLLAKHRDADPDDFLAAATVLLDGQATVTRSSRVALLEITVHGVTKASGLAELAGTLGIAPHEVVAVGDMPNDLPMLEWAGTSYAVANAHADVLDLADHVLVSNDEDAVAQLLESLTPR